MTISSPLPSLSSPLSIIDNMLPRHLKTMERACYAGEEVVKKACRGIVKEYDNRIRKSKQIAAKRGKTTNDYISALERSKRILIRAGKQAIKATSAVIETRNELFKDLSEDEFKARMEAILRIPADDLKGFDKLDTDERALRLTELIKEYETGGNGCSYAPNMINAPGNVSPHHTNESTDPVTGSKKLPQFLYELIDRFIFEAIRPSFHRGVFFVKTKKGKDGKRKFVERWQACKRQIRAEGRMAMVKVMIVLVKRLDYKVSMRVGSPYRDKATGYQEFHGILREDIANEANLSLNSVKVALRNLEKSGALYEAKQKRDEYEPNKFAGLAVVRVVKESLVHALGLVDKLLDDRNAKKNGTDVSAPASAPELTQDQVDASDFAADMMFDKLKKQGLMA